MNAAGRTNAYFLLPRELTTGRHPPTQGAKLFQTRNNASRHMPTVQENKAFWGKRESWIAQGEEWSKRWGGSSAQWWWAIYPRIHRFIPTDTILEIACGYGRWSAYLKGFAEKLVLVDLVEDCIEACKQRFRNSGNIEYYVNDGKSLDMVADRSVDFIFSFDSLVHAEEDVIRSYLDAISTKLKKNGVAFIHHSNAGHYSGPLWGFKRYVNKRSWSTFPDQSSANASRAKGGLLVSLYHAARPLLGAVGYEIADGRAFSMTAEKFARFAEESELCCMCQEVINWNDWKLTDCMSIATPKGSIWQTPNRVTKNRDFVKARKRIRNLSILYEPWSPSQVKPTL